MVHNHKAVLVNLVYAEMVAVLPCVEFGMVVVLVCVEFGMVVVMVGLVRMMLEVNVWYFWKTS